MTAESDSRQRFEHCIDRHADSLYRVAFRLMGDRELAEELVQETYLNAWRGIGSLKDASKMRSWLFAIMRNQHTKLLRRIPKLETQADELPQLAVANPETKETEQIVQVAMQQLDDNQKLPLLLVAIEGMSVNEAAEVLDIPRGTVLSRLHRGREKLKLILQTEFETH